MPNYFLDTSALAKLYHQEAGSEYVDRVISEPGSRCTISRLSIVEMESVFTIKVRTGEIGEAQAEVAKRSFRADLSQGRLVLGPLVSESQFQRARALLAKFAVAEGLRTLDAIQLAVGLELKDSDQTTILVAADQTLCRVAQRAGCPAVNPEDQSTF